MLDDHLLLANDHIWSHCLFVLRFTECPAGFEDDALADELLVDNVQENQLTQFLDAHDDFPFDPMDSFSDLDAKRTSFLDLLRRFAKYPDMQFGDEDVLTVAELPAHLKPEIGLSMMEQINRGLGRLYLLKGIEYDNHFVERCEEFGMLEHVFRLAISVHCCGDVAISVVSARDTMTPCGSTKST